VETSSRTVQLCIAGTQAEYERRLDDARRMYQEAWDVATDDYDACVAAHYIAHLDPDPSQALLWNLEALERARRVPDLTAEFLASLYVNLGRSYELAGDRTHAEPLQTLGGAWAGAPGRVAARASLKTGIPCCVGRTERERRQPAQASAAAVGRWRRMPVEGDRIAAGRATWSCSRPGRDGQDERGV
jgi:hypothetical protein